MLVNLGGHPCYMYLAVKLGGTFSLLVRAVLDLLWIKTLLQEFGGCTFNVTCLQAVVSVG